MRAGRMADEQQDGQAQAEESTIRRISPAVSHRICSGQVIVDLSTAVKELLENALDAGATSVEVKLQDYGAKLIEVADNGKGVPPSDYESLALKYHTSKLHTFDDLEVLSTYGFRGEALSSLCALADVTVVTRTQDQQVGSSLEFNKEGVLVKQSLAPRAVGTTVALRNLFSPLPVRHKEFQRNVKREFAKLVGVLQAYALISTKVRLSASNQVAGGSRAVLVSTQATAPAASPSSATTAPAAVSAGCRPPEGVSLAALRTNIVTVLGTKVADTLEPLDIEVPNLGARLAGFVSKAQQGARGGGDSVRQFLYINGRPVDMPRLIKVLNETFRSLTSAINFSVKPTAILELTLPTQSYDINVTPDKRKVFMECENDIVAALKEALEALWEKSRYTYAVNTTATGGDGGRVGAGSSQATLLGAGPPSQLPSSSQRRPVAALLGAAGKGAPQQRKISAFLRAGACTRDSSELGPGMTQGEGNAREQDLSPDGDTQPEPEGLQGAHTDSQASAGAMAGRSTGTAAVSQQLVTLPAHPSTGGTQPGSAWEDARPAEILAGQEVRSDAPPGTGTGSPPQQLEPVRNAASDCPFELPVFVTPPALVPGSSGAIAAGGSAAVGDELLDDIWPTVTLPGPGSPGASPRLRSLLPTGQRGNPGALGLPGAQQPILSPVGQAQCSDPGSLPGGEGSPKEGTTGVSTSELSCSPAMPHSQRAAAGQAGQNGASMSLGGGADWLPFGTQLPQPTQVSPRTQLYPNAQQEALSPSRSGVARAQQGLDRSPEAVAGAAIARQAAHPFLRLFDHFSAAHTPAVEPLREYEAAQPDATPAKPSAQAQLPCSAGTLGVQGQPGAGPSESDQLPPTVPPQTRVTGASPPTHTTPAARGLQDRGLAVSVKCDMARLRQVVAARVTRMATQSAVQQSGADPAAASRPQAAAGQDVVQEQAAMEAEAAGAADTGTGAVPAEHDTMEGVETARPHKRRRRREFASASLQAEGQGSRSEREAAAESELERVFDKAEFRDMTVIGQFNLGFMLTRLGPDIFIIDQHAADEKKTFEHLQATVVLNCQSLLVPRPLNLPYLDEMIVRDHLDTVFRRNGFDCRDDPKTGALMLAAVPYVKGVTFGPEEVRELIGKLKEDSGVRKEALRPARLRAVLASKACRSSIMIGKALDVKSMTRLVHSLADLDSPWNCPHGRPTMRHVCVLPEAS